jgi:hypothetical protein
MSKIDGTYEQANSELEATQTRDSGILEASPSSGWREVAAAMHADPGRSQTHREVDS